MLVSTKILPLGAPPADGNLGPWQITDREIKEKELQAAEQNNSNQDPAAVATHTRTIGIIHPPPDIRAIVEKTAKHVSLSLGLEYTIKAQNAGKPQFNFLNSSDPYHAFYQHKLREYLSRNQHGAQAAADSVAKPDDASVDNAKPDDLQAQFRVPTTKLLEGAPEAELYTVRFPQGITEEELGIIKLTAQFTARNGQSFLKGLYVREINNPQFQFVKPTHSMSPFFDALVKAYTKVLTPPKDLKEKIAADMTTLLERCLDRLEWDRFQEMQRKKDEDEREMERFQMALIDWHDFGVVTSIDFADEGDEALPLPKTREEVVMGSKVSAMVEDEVFKPGKQVEMEMEMEMEMDEEEVNLVAQGMRIVRNWKRPEDRIQTERDLCKVVVSPISGELIPISDMSEHMRISLIDPKFKEQKDRVFAKIRETSLAQDDEIAKNIVGLARLRPDIFGTTEEEVSNAVKAAMEKNKDEQVIWDGHTANQALTLNYNGEEQGHGVYGDPNSFPGPAALPPPGPGVPTVWPLPPPSNIALSLPPSVQHPGALRPFGVPMMQPMHQQHQFFMPGSPQMQPGMHVPPPPGSQFAHIHQVPRPYGQLLPSSMGMMQPPPMPGVHPPPPPEETPPPLPEEPETKRQKLDEAALVPEDQFLAQHPDSATIRVSGPNVDDGQVIEIIVQTLSENVGSLKEKIAGEIQIPANKQKLSGKAGFLKDNMSLAHYNVGAGEILTLSLRERGGRKR